ncbi:glycosyl hydrolases family 43-domain-containing protein [Lasiosphaeris hirsuta]|uniref:non-reducing end alpha-L-arabinofuranosidase n=1 Tax=Lasiosphaeris hirsuta TaxID=260670 RepID=A0AA39ZRG7_9PEZI|nr:glycosyl hydrolases family 43-domain-containing protein [Lasiosphaeris hirsuta]
MVYSLRKTLATTALGILAGLAALGSASPAVSYNNTLINQRADPHINKHTDGWYYFTATVPEFDKIVLRRAQSIQALASAPETTIWKRKASGVGSGQVWAPELHYIDGKWYIYVALGVSGQWRIRAFVLEGTGANPLSANWVEKGIIKTNWDTFSLDASTFVVNGTRYLVWAQQEPSRSDENSSLMLAPLQNPWTLGATAVAISRPTLPWERRGYKVNEGPSAIQRNGNVFLTYSASATDYNYCMGLLTASASSNLMDPASWSKEPNPVFASNADTQQFGPGHNSFTVSEDGQSDIIVYHDRGYRDIKGDPLNDPNRRTRVQKLYWKANGTPDFGVPVAEGPTPVRLRSFNNSGYVQYKLSSQSNAITPSLAETQFRLASPGLAGGSSVSLESAAKPGAFLRRSGSQFRFEVKGSASSFAREASFIQHAGLADAAGVSFESVDMQGQYLHLSSDGSLLLLTGGTSAQGTTSTFYLE